MAMAINGISVVTIMSMLAYNIEVASVKMLASSWRQAYIKASRHLMAPRLIRPRRRPLRRNNGRYYRRIAVIGLRGVAA
jgi:hypothetical protein